MATALLPSSLAQEGGDPARRRQSWLPAPATHTRHAKEYSRTWQSIVSIPTAVSAPVQHTEAHTNV